MHARKSEAAAAVDEEEPPAAAVVALVLFEDLLPHAVRAIAIAAKPAITAVIRTRSTETP
jgi:hypothetical protein